VEEEAERDDGREARAVETEILHDRLEEGPDRVADTRRDERGDRECRDHVPAVEDRAISHGFTTIAQLRRPHWSCFSRWPARRSASATMVRVGLAKPPVGKTEL